MKILVLTNMFPSKEKPWWGAFVEEQVDDLRRAGVEVSVIGFDGTESSWNYIRACRALRRAVKAQRFDIVHAHYGLTGAIALVQRRCPIVTTFHGGDYSGLVPWHRPISCFVAHLSTPVVVSADGARRLGVPGAALIPAGVNTDRFRPEDRLAARRKLGLNEGAAYALLLGARDDLNKRLDLFDAAVSNARASVPDLRTLSLEGLDRDEVVTLMNAADVSVLTSDTEGSPVAVRESLACLTPVVSVRVGDVPDVLANLPGCAVVLRDPAQIASAIVMALRAGRPAALRERAEETSGKVVAERLIALYSELISRRS